MNIIDSDILARIRSEICNALLIWLLACGFFALCTTIIQGSGFIPARVLVGNSAIFVILGGVTLARRKLPYVARAGVVIGLGLVAGISRLIIFGVPYGMVPLAMTIIMGAVFFGERAGVAIAVAVFAAFGAIYLGFTYGFIPPPGVSPPPLSVSTWLVSAAVLAATTLGPVIAVSRVSQRLEFERRHAEATSAAKSEFLATMGHELKTPLNAIMGFAEALGMGYAGPPDSTRSREYTDHIHRSAQHLLTIVDDLLELVRVDALQRKAVAKILGVDIELRKAVSSVETLLATAGLELQLNVAEGLPSMVADPTLFQQIMINLLSNAIKFTPAGGAVTVTAGTVDECIRIEVSDTGIGIPADEIPKLCQPFRQADHMTASAREGSGLGLALVKTFTELQAGKLSIRSAAGAGTTVTIDLPVATSLAS